MSKLKFFEGIIAIASVMTGTVIEHKIDQLTYPKHENGNEDPYLGKSLPAHEHIQKSDIQKKDVQIMGASHESDE